MHYLLQPRHQALEVRLSQATHLTAAPPARARIHALDPPREIEVQEDALLARSRDLSPLPDAMDDLLARNQDETATGEAAPDHARILLHFPAHVPHPAVVRARIRLRGLARQ